MSGKKKGLWEKRKIEETKKDGKKFWNVIKRTPRKEQGEGRRGFCVYRRRRKENHRRS